MTHRRLGATDLKIAPLVLGGNVFGWTADRAASFAVLDAFVDGASQYGAPMIDTADVYSAWIEGNSGGESETMIGEWLKASGKRDQVLIATKVGWAPDQGGNLDPAHIAQACDASLRRLGTDRIDVYFAHQDDRRVPQQTVAEAFARLVEAGKVRILGASNFTAARVKSAVEGARAAGLPHYQVIEPLYNLVTRDRFEGELQDYCVEYNIGVTPYYGLAAGFLTGKYRSHADLAGRARAGSVRSLLDGNGPRVLAAMDDIAAETGATLPQIALAWLLAQDGVTAPIASATNAAQVAELLPAITLTLGRDHLATLDAAGT